MPIRENLMSGTKTNVVIGAASGNASALFELSSTSQGALITRMTTAQRQAISAPAEGLLVYDTTLHKMTVYTTAWEIVTSAAE